MRLSAFFSIITVNLGVMLLSEIIFNIKNLRAGGIQSDDENISDRQYAFIINYYRSKLIKQEIESHKGISQEDIQDLGKVPVVQADPHECCEIDDDCILRTEKSIPSTLDVKHNKHGITYVGLYSNKPFQETTWNRVVWDQHAKYTGNKPKWFFKGGYIYFVNAPGMMEHVNIQGLFEDPTEANSFRTCDCPENDVDCQVGFDYEYPMAAHHIDTIVKLIAETELRLSTLIPEDTSNDSLDSN